MPPVFGPWSPSKTVLWSWAAASGSASAPLASAKNETSSPDRNSSTTTAAPAAPKAARSMHSATASSSASGVSGTHTAWRAMPGLPGAVKSAVTRGLWAIFQASACSRPPPPTSSTLTRALSFGLALVGRLDELEMGARDPRPGAARVEVEVALPVSDRLRAALDPHQRAGEVKVGVERGAEEIGRAHV